MVGLRRYRGRHLRPRPKKRGVAVVGTATAVWLASPPARAATYVVKRGDTLAAIADRYRTSVGALADANGLRNPNLILAGQRLRIPGRARVSSIHVVQPGQTLSHIAARYGTSVRAIARANDLRDPNLIVAGARLRIPRALPAPSYAAPSASVAQTLDRHARSHGVDPALVKAVAWQESGWNQGARSVAGAIGIMQVLPATARFVNQVLGGHRLRVRVADDNVHLGVMYLRHMLATTRSERHALAAYYSGPGAVGRRLKPYQRAYVRSVRALKARFR